MEFLKGVQYILFTTISIESPLFFIIWYMGNVLHSITNPVAYIDPYEKSLFFSNIALFVILMVQNWSDDSLCSTITSQAITSQLDYISIAVVVIFMLFEPIFEKYIFKLNEVCYCKIYTRLWYSLSALFGVFVSNSVSIKYVWLYAIGYYMLSAAIQYYSACKINAKEQNDIDNMATMPIYTPK